MSISCASADVVFQDDFQNYDVGDAADFSIGGVLTGNWTASPIAVVGARASEIFNTGNFGGSRIWVSIADGTSIISKGVSVESDTDYEFSVFMAVETGNAGRQLDVSYDLLIGPDAGSAVSIFGGAVGVIAHSDPYEVDNSKVDHVFIEPFTTGAINDGEKLFIVITRIGNVAGVTGGFLAVDDVIVQTPPLVETRYDIMFADDFQAYDEEYGSDLSVGDVAVGDWTPTNMTDENASRIFDTANFGGSRTWITNVNGTGLVSRAIELNSETDYTFSAMFFSGTSAGDRMIDAEYDLIIAGDAGITSGIPYSIAGGPQTVVTHGDNWSVVDSKVDHIFSLDFTTPVLTSEQRLYIAITRVGVNADSSSDAWMGVDDVKVQETPLIVIEEVVSASLTEGDTTGFTYEVSLRREPAANVEVTVSPVSGGSGKDLDLGDGPGVSVVLTFTPLDWDVAQSVTVIANDDDAIEGYHGAVVTHYSSSEDILFDGFYSTFDVEIIDNDMPMTASNAFVNGEGGHNVYRIQTMTVCKDGSVVVAAEGRPSTADPGHSGDIAMTVRRSPDGGITWGEYFDIQDDAGFDFSDPRLVTDEATGRVHLLYTRWATLIGQSRAGVGLGDDTSNTFYAYSDDHGVTWASPANITAMVKDPTWRVINTGPGIATQLKFQADPARNGRLIMAAHRINGNGQYAGAPICSDDNGATWFVAGETDNVSLNESEVVELTNGDLMWDARPGGGTRKRFLSVDGGQSWGDMYYGDVPMTTCAAGLDRFSAKREGDDRDRILFAGPLGRPHLSASGRYDAGVWTSYDEGKTFINPVMIERASAAYTLVDKMANGNVGVFYEYGGYKKIRLVQFPMDMLEGGLHSEDMLSYDGFNNQIDRKRGGIGWSGLWFTDADFTNDYVPQFDGSSVSFDGLTLDKLDGRIDLAGGKFAIRQLASEIDLGSNSTTYFSMLISGALDSTFDENSAENLTIELQDAAGVGHCSFGINSDEAVVVSSPGGIVTGQSSAIDPAKSYLVVAKLAGEVAGTSGGQLLVKVFESGETIVNVELDNDWTVVGNADVDSDAILDRIAIFGGNAATWSVDEVRVGTTYQSVTGVILPSCGQEETVYLQGDINQDCYVNILDFAIMAQDWLRCTDPHNPIECN